MRTEQPSLLQSNSCERMHTVLIGLSAGYTIEPIKSLYLYFRRSENAPEALKCTASQFSWFFKNLQLAEKKDFSLNLNYFV